MKGLVQLLLGLNVLTAGVIAYCSGPPRTEYVLTPFYQVVPERSVWTAEEVQALGGEMPNALEARDMANGFARLGSTLSVDDVLKGIDALESSEYPLSTQQKENIYQRVEVLKKDHQRIVRVQRELISLERALRTQAVELGIIEIGTIDRGIIEQSIDKGGSP